MFIRFRAMPYLNNAPALSSALISAGVPEDVAAIIAADALTYDKLERPEYWMVGLGVSLTGAMLLLSASAAYNAASFLAGWPGIIGVALCVAVGFVAGHFLLSRYLKAFRAYRFTGIALNRSVMLAGPLNVAALDRAEGLSGEDYIQAVLGNSFFRPSVFIFGIFVAFVVFMMSLH
ncbi:MAG TPA: hypothetical protein PK417_07365 [Hyphomonas sp.]|nr:hypothetical protein [Hyphomonas sp.]HRX75301.1 hypothetical protein [Hyphomonas sp.]